MMKILLITPPMTQVNSPYPATAYLTQYLRELGYQCDQKDLGLDLFHELFSTEGLKKIIDYITAKNVRTEIEDFFLDASGDYLNTIEPVKKFLQGKDPTLALRISKRQFVPEGPRFAPLDEHEDDINSLFGEMGVQDKAKYIASLYLDDIADIIKNSIDPHFEFSRYGESLASSQSSFNPLYQALNAKTKTLVDETMLNIVKQYLEKGPYDVVGFTLPFPGNVYAALRSAQLIKKFSPRTKIVAGGGYVNTELRELSDCRFFEFVDFLIFDDGEAPLRVLLEIINNGLSFEKLQHGTWYLKNGAIIKASEKRVDVAFKTLKGPSFDGLDLNRYIPMLELPNPMHRMWSDFRWNKMIIAHGCYWKKCTFCDVSLDYIDRYEPARADSLIKSIERIQKETNQSGFHFVDEAAPPALVKSLSEKIIEKNLKITWWGNLRFDKQFEHLASLMADSGCVAVTGGLEVASPRILSMIDKGISVEQVARVTKSFSNNGIYVHSYLMYGFPTQTTQEIIDSLEVVRQLFENDCIHSAFWHRFMCTAHSPVGLNPDKFNIKLHEINIPQEGLFSKNTIYFTDPTQPDLDFLGDGLRKATYNFMHGLGFKEDVRAWFEGNVPKTTIAKNFISKNL